MQALAIAIILGSQALFNHIGIRATTILTDFSGYLIFVVAIILTVGMLAYAPGIDIGRLFTFTNNTGDAGGGVWPQTNSVMMAFLLGLLLPAYTVTGFDASAHTSEETRQASVNVPKGMIRSVFWSFLFGYVMICSFVLAMPSVADGAKQGGTVFFWLMDGIGIPAGPQGPSLHRHRDLELSLRAGRHDLALADDLRLRPRRRLPGVNLAASWSARRTARRSMRSGSAPSSPSSPPSTRRSSGRLASGCAIFLYLSYAAPIGAGMLAEGKTWTKKGPFNLGALSKPFAIISVLGGLLLFFIGVQPPNSALITYTIVLPGHHGGAVVRRCPSAGSRARRSATSSPSAKP